MSRRKNLRWARRNVGCLIAAEATNLHQFFVVAYVFYVGKKVGTPANNPQMLLHAAIFVSWDHLPVVEQPDRL